MSFDYSELAEVSVEMIEEFGVMFVLTKASTDEVVDPVTDETTPGTPGSVHDVKGLLLDPDEDYIASVGSSNVQAGDQVIYIGPEVEPEDTDTVTMLDGEVWQVVHITKLRPGGVPLMYTIQVRP